MHSHYSPVTEEVRQKETEDWTRHFAYWASLAKERMEKHSALLNDPDALDKELADINEHGRAMLKALQIVEYVDSED